MKSQENSVLKEIFEEDYGAYFAPVETESQLKKQIQACTNCVLLIQGRLAKDVIPQIHSLTQLERIYILTGPFSVQVNKAMAGTYPKIRGVTSDLVEALAFCSKEFSTQA